MNDPSKVAQDCKRFPMPGGDFVVYGDNNEDCYQRQLWTDHRNKLLGLKKGARAVHGLGGAGRGWRVAAWFATEPMCAAGRARE